MPDQQQTPNESKFNIVEQMAQLIASQVYASFHEEFNRDRLYSPGIRPSTEVLHVSDSLCSSCAALLRAPQDTMLCLYSSYTAFDRSSRTCPLCYKFSHELMSPLNRSKVRGRFQECRLEGLIRDEDCLVQVWARCRGSGAYSSFIEVFCGVNIELGSFPSLGSKLGGEFGTWGYGPTLRATDTQTRSSSSDNIGRSPFIASQISRLAEIGAPLHRAILPLFNLSANTAKLVGKISQEALPTTTGTMGRMNLAQKWLRTCLNNHTTCEWSQKEVSLPRRVIDVGPADGSQQPKLRETLEEAGSYVCLSHRWGGSNVLTTTSTNLEDRKIAIIESSMPKTFQDAIFVVRQLGYRYLWIDSLCILQDRLDDWEQEAGQMDRIYRNALFTIFAAAATCADSGCFMPLSDTSTLPVQLGTVYVAKEQGGRTMRFDKTYSLFAQGTQHYAPIEDSQIRFRPRNPLDSRAWVLQEEILSQRSLIFTHSGMYWECGELEASESFPNGAARVFARTSGDSFDYRFLSISNTSSNSFKQGLRLDIRRPEGGQTIFASRSDSNEKDWETTYPSPNEDWETSRMILLAVFARVRQHIITIFPGSVWGPSITPEQMQREWNKDDWRHSVADVLSGSVSVVPGGYDPGDSETPRVPAFDRKDFKLQPYALPQSDHWTQIVTDYSGRNLTHESDRIPAIKGLAKYMERYQKDQFLFGLWRSTVVRDLLWRVDGVECTHQYLCECVGPSPQRFHRDTPQRQISQGLPSWSWASVSRGVRYWDPDPLLDLIKLARRNDDTKDRRPERLTVRGVLRSIRAVSKQDKRLDTITEHGRGHIYSTSHSKPLRVADFWPDEDHRLDEVLLCMPTAYFTGLELRDVPKQIRCLILRPTHDCYLRNRKSDKFEFERVGVAAFSNEHAAFLGLNRERLEKLKQEVEKGELPSPALALNDRMVNVMSESLDGVWNTEPHTLDII